MSRSMRSLAVNSGLLSVYYRTALTGLIAQNSAITLWEVPTGTVIVGGFVLRNVLDTTAGADIVVETTEAVVKALMPLDISAASAAVFVPTLLLSIPIVGTAAQRTIRLRNTVAGTGDGSYTVCIWATRPGPEPQAAA